MNNLREQIVAEIMNLVRPAPIPMDHKLSIDEIEKMLNSDNPQRISLAPDGSAMIEAPPHTVGDIADAVLRVMGPSISASDKVIEAAHHVVLEKCATLKGGNGIEMEDGEKGYIVHSELLWHLECAVADYEKQKSTFKSVKV